MPKKRSPEPPGLPQVSPEQGIELLIAQIKNAETLLANRPLDKDDYGTWELVTKNYLQKAFGVNSPNVFSVINVGKMGFVTRNLSESWWDNHRAESLTTKVKRLEGSY